MHLSDRTTGAALTTLGALAFFFGSRLPPTPGQPVGPSVFPMVVGAGLVICGALIAFGIGQRFEEEAEADLAKIGGDKVHEEAPPGKGWLALLPPALLVFYVLVSERLGFAPTAAIMIAATAWAFDAPRRWILPLAVAAPVFIHLVFYKLLRVPLPPGLLPMPW